MFQKSRKKKKLKNGKMFRLCVEKKKAIKNKTKQKNKKQQKTKTKTKTNTNSEVIDMTIIIDFDIFD